MPPPTQTPPPPPPPTPQAADRIIAVSSRRQRQTVARLAAEIWRDHYTPIIGNAQVEYMLEKFQSLEAISEQIAHHGYRYYLLQHDHQAVGYLALQPQQEVLFLSKIYLRKSARGQGLGKQAMHLVVQLANELNLPKIRLTVNKHNTIAIAAYKRFGLTRIGKQVTDIGGGYVMDDYVFEAKLPIGEMGGRGI